ncbi:MAG: DUF3105 domain-containing protein [Thermomicrobiales bacterium]|nr:DUF3105 domain-containing protein [Thermomicrobiales bacterium]
MTTNSEIRLALPQEQRNAHTIRRWKIIIAISMLTILVVSAVNVYLIDRRPSIPDEIEGVTHYDNLPNGIVSGPIEYDHTPPVGGMHDQYAQLCGYYRVPVEDRNIVASLATGAVWIAYRPDLSEHDFQTLRSASDGVLDVLITPYPGLQAPVVLTAWGRQMEIQDPSDERIKLFVYVYKNREWAPERDKSCSIGVGLPSPE